jgi:hypothetical protein
LAIVRTECGTLAELVSAFLDLTADYEVPVGTVVVFSSLTHLSMHGFPVMAGGLQDKSCIRALREVEVWLSEADKRNQHTLPNTSKAFTEQFLILNSAEHPNSTALPEATANTANHSNNTEQLRTGIELLASLHSLAKVNIHSPEWDDLPGGLPILTDEQEANFLTGMLDELNEKFALQLDTCPCTDRSGHSAADSETESEIVIALAGSSHEQTRWATDGHLPKGRGCQCPRLPHFRKIGRFDGRRSNCRLGGS